MTMEKHEVVFLNPRTCGIYKSGGVRYKTDHATGRRTDEVDNELLEAVKEYIAGRTAHGEARIPMDDVFQNQVIVPTYYDERYNVQIEKLIAAEGCGRMTLGELIDDGILSVRGGHGSPGNDQRTGHIPYVKVSDIRGLRVNVNPTNLVSESVARRFWCGDDSKIRAWDVITPNRASSNIGEFAIILPGEERVVLTKEVFIFRVLDGGKIDPFYLLWAFALKAVREQWRRVTLMQTNREDCGARYREIIIPYPESQEWALEKSKAFRDYFTTIAEAKTKFTKSLEEDSHEYIANALSGLATDEQDEVEDTQIEGVGDEGDEGMEGSE